MRRRLVRVSLIAIILTIIAIIFPAFKNEDDTNKEKIKEVYLIDNEDIEYFGVIDGYHIYKDYKPRCSVYIGPVEQGIYNFGVYSSGCDDNLDWIGFSAIKNGEFSNIQSLVDDGEIYVWKLYFKIYLWNKQNL